MKYKNEGEILEIVRAFENGTIARTEWRHAEHLTVAPYYVLHQDSDAALIKMRDGIFSLLKAFAVNFSKEMPYHETLTVFWLKTVDDYAKSHADNDLMEIGNALIEIFDKDFSLKFYSRKLLFSNEARAEYVAGDLKR